MDEEEPNLQDQHLPKILTIRQSQDKKLGLPMTALHLAVPGQLPQTRSHFLSLSAQPRETECFLQERGKPAIAAIRHQYFHVDMCTLHKSLLITN